MVGQLPQLPKIGQLLKLYGVRAMKHLSQNFILDMQLSSKMITVSTISIKEG